MPCITVRGMFGTTSTIITEYNFLHLWEMVLIGLIHYLAQANTLVQSFLMLLAHTSNLQITVVDLEQMLVMVTLLLLLQFILMVLIKSIADQLQVWILTTSQQALLLHLFQVAYNFVNQVHLKVSLFGRL